MSRRNRLEGFICVWRMLPSKDVESKAKEDELKDDNKESNDDNKANFTRCNVYELYNTVQFGWTKVFIDIRPKKEFEIMAATQFINMPYDLLSDQDCDEKVIGIISQEKKKKLGEEIEFIYCISNKQLIDNQSDIKFCSYLKEIICDTFELTKTSIIILDTEFNTFYEKFPFLCYGPNDDKRDIERYPSQIINDKLFLGNMTNATSKKVLLDLKINFILNMTQQFTCQIFDVDPDLKIKYLQCPLYDDENAQIQQYFEKGINFIVNALSNDNGKILVHCQGLLCFDTNIPTITMKYICIHSQLVYHGVLQ